MNEKPTYEELEQRVRHLEQGAVEFKLLQLVLQGSENKYRALVDNAADIIYRINTRGRFVFVNSAALQSGGYRQAELIGRHWGEIVAPAYRVRALRFYSRQFIRRIPQTYFELPVLTSDNRELWLGQHVHLGISNGEVTGWQAIARDITARKQAREDLLKSEQKFAALFHLNPNPIVLTDLATGKIININEAFAQQTGYPAAAAVGRTPQELNLWVNPDDRQKIITALQEKGEISGAETKMRQSDGSVRNVLLAGRLIELDARKHILILAQDITERRQAQQARRESEQRFRGIAEAMTQLVWVSAKSGVSVYHNPEFVRYTGLQETTFAERVQLIHPADRPYVLQQWQNYRREPEPPGGYIVQGTFRLRRQDGVYRWFLCRAIRKDNGPDNFQWVGAATDIDDLIRAEQNLQENLEILAEAEQIGQTGSWKRVLDTNELVWSAGTRRIMGLAPDEKESFARFQALVHPDDLPGLQEKLAAIAAGGTPFTTEFRINRPDGGLRHIVARGEAKLDGQNRPFLVYGTVQDVTERKILEDELVKAQKLDSIGTLAGGLAHDYNNLLAAIMGYMDMAKMDIPRTNEAYVNLLHAGEAARTAQELTRQLITFSEGGRPQCQLINVRQLLTESVSLALNGSGMQTEMEIAPDLPEIKADKSQIFQVIRNVVLNAREAVPLEGRLFISADKAVLEPDNPFLLTAGSYVRLLFRDNGPGIPACYIDRIFDPYFSSKSRGSIKGMGLGLTICYSILKRHHGHITVESVAGTGTTVTVYIPAAGNPREGGMAARAS